MISTQSNETSEAIRQLREQFNTALKRQAERIEDLGQGLRLLQDDEKQFENTATRLIGLLEEALETSDELTEVSSPSAILSSVCRLTRAAYAERVFEVLAQEAGRMGSQVALFDVRGRAAWGVLSSGFSPDLPVEAMRALVVPLNIEGPFREVFETAEAVATTAEGLQKNRSLLAKLSPAADARILLIPVRSAGSVAAILYADIGERRDSGFVDRLKVLAEFAGAQIDRLMAISGDLVGEETAEKSDQGSANTEATSGNGVATGAWEGASITEGKQVAGSGGGPLEFPSPTPQEAPVPVVSARPGGRPNGHQYTPQLLDIADLSDDDQKVHRDAQRFARLLVSEIELYNKSGVEEGRRNKDLYRRLKKDIDRSRETYEKRFASTVASQVDYFHEELAKTLAENDPMQLGSDYPGPSV